MRSTHWKDIAEVSGMAAIVASLAFVGLELRQSRQIAIADIYQQQSALAVQIQTRASEELYSRVLMKSVSGEPMSEAEAMIYQSEIITPGLIYLENNHFQYEMELLSEEHWQANVRGLREWAKDRLFREAWPDMRTHWRTSFAELIDELIEEEQP